MVLIGQTREGRLWTGESREIGISLGGLEQVPSIQVGDESALGGAVQSIRESPAHHW